jgi:hypothetical protein
MKGNELFKVLNEQKEGPMHSSGRGYKKGLKAFAEVSRNLAAIEDRLGR